MTIVSATRGDLSNNTVPNHLKDYLTQVEWHKVSKTLEIEVDSSGSNAYRMECCFLCFSLCLLLPCMCYYHKTNKEKFYKENALQIIAGFNRDYFNSHPVIVYVPSAFGIDTEEFDRARTGPATAPTAVPISMLNDNPIVHANPRIFSVVIPPNAPPGSTIIAIAPDNVTRVNVVIPEGVKEGQTIDVTY